MVNTFIHKYTGLNFIEIMYMSVGGAMMSRTVLQMLLPPKYSFRRLLNELLKILLRMEALARKLPPAIVIQYYEDWNSDGASCSKDMEEKEMEKVGLLRKWSWFLDMERSCSHLVGRLIGDMIRGPSLSTDEERCFQWLNSRVSSTFLLHDYQTYIRNGRS